MTVFRALLLTVALLAAGPLLEPRGAAISAQQHQCNYCHDIHGGGFDGNTALGREQFAIDVCLTCHSDAGPGYLVGPDPVNDTVTSSLTLVEVHAGSYHAVGDTTSCWDCHDHEAEEGGNIKMIPRIRSLPSGGDTVVVFTNNTTQADFTGTDGICAVCHTDPTTSSTGTTGHNGPDVCTTCHGHDAGFQGEGGGCTGCHNSTRGPRRIITDDFARASHHVTGAVADADCEVCHDQVSGHTSDSNGVLLFDHDGGASIQLTYTADPFGVSADAAQLEPFCLGCHGDGTANGPTSTPFSTGAAIPAVDEAVWNASSHGGAAAVAGGCVGDGAFGCHGNGHGSEKLKLLAPYATVPNATTKYEEEEGFCFGCHDGATASTDIQSQFDPATINWVSGGWGVNSIATFNDRHDVRHEAASVSGAKIECADCHRPHADNAAQKYNPDPDPSSAATTWAGQSAMDRFCVDCHDGGLPTGVQDHAGGPMGDIATFYSTIEKHGPTASAGEQLNATVFMETAVGAGDTVEVANPWIGDPVLSCDLCHRPHPKAASEWPGALKYDYFSLQDTVRAPDGRGIYYSQIEGTGMATYTAIYWDYGLTEDDSKASAGEDAYGGYFCNVCHDRRGMNGKNTCGSSGCHRHGGSTGM